MKIFQTGGSERLRNLGSVRLEPGLSRREVRTVLRTQTESSWRTVLYRGSDLSSAPSPLLSQALTASSLRELEHSNSSFCLLPFLGFAVSLKV